MDQMGQMLLLMQQQQQMMASNMQQQRQMMATVMGVLAQNLGMPEPEAPGLATPATNTNNIYEQFQRHRPPTFADTHRPEEAEYWLNRVTKLLRPLHCSEEENVELVSYLFEKEADLWWESVLRSIPKNHIWTWEHERENEFLRLQQGGMSVAQYENRFTKLSRYASEMIANEAIKMRRFTARLRSGICSKMCCTTLKTYVELVKMSIRAEQDEKRVARTHLQLGPWSMMEGPSSPFTRKRPRPNSPPRLAVAPAPSTRPTKIYGYCRRTGHSEPYCFTRMRDLGFTPPQRTNRPPQQAL
ncbi:uncharacterized protein LOC131219118 [Magnolia sinica]|uniref:uncharacterized protein LOC131219118 n=1 Tax=Magnolia sinica TaxID=86752 RepID=UPI00265AFA25|nr:uncharacterized protein LOC131219118 [Magnolia sinica]